MEQKYNTKSKRVGLFAAAGLMMVSAFLFWIADIGTVFALCLGAAALCFLGAAINVNEEKS